MLISPKAVIFDYGNVLSASQPEADAEAMAAILNLPAARFTELYWRFRIPYDAGSLDAAAYWNTVAEAAARALAADQIAALIEIDSRSWSHPAPVMPQWAGESTQGRAANRNSFQHARPGPRLCAALLLAARVRCGNILLRCRHLQAGARDLSTIACGN